MPRRFWQSTPAAGFDIGMAVIKFGTEAAGKEATGATTAKRRLIVAVARYYLARTDVWNGKREMTDNTKQKTENEGETPQPQSGGDDSADSRRAGSQPGQHAVEQVFGGVPYGWDNLIGKAEKWFRHWLDSNAEAMIRRYYLMIAGMFCVLFICLCAFALAAYAIGKGEGDFGMWLFGGSVAVACVTAISVIARQIGRQPQVAETPGEQHGRQNQ